MVENSQHGEEPLGESLALRFHVRHYSHLSAKRLSLTQGIAFLTCNLVSGNPAARDVILEPLQEVTVQKDELPHACPDGQLVLRLDSPLLRKGVIQLLENVMLKRLKRPEGNEPQLGLDGQRQADNLFAWVEAPERMSFPDPIKAVHLMNLGNEIMLNYN